MEVIKKSTNKNTKKLHGKPSNVEGKTMGKSDQSTIISLGTNTIISLGTNTTSPQNR